MGKVNGNSNKVLKPVVCGDPTAPYIIQRFRVTLTDGPTQGPTPVSTPCSPEHMASTNTRVEEMKSGSSGTFSARRRPDLRALIDARSETPEPFMFPRTTMEVQENHKHTAMAVQGLQQPTATEVEEVHKPTATSAPRLLDPAFTITFPEPIEWPANDAALCPPRTVSVCHLYMAWYKHKVINETVFPQVEMEKLSKAIRDKFKAAKAAGSEEWDEWKRIAVECHAIWLRSGKDRINYAEIAKNIGDNKPVRRPRVEWAMVVDKKGNISYINRR